jgi:hypothetical protein
MIEIVHIPDKDNIVADALSRYPQENGPSYEHVVDQEGIVDLDCYHLLSFQSPHARALQVDNFATPNSVSATEQAALVHEWAGEQAVSSEGMEVEQIARVSMEDLTQAQAEGYASSMLSVSVELEDFVAEYHDCTDFKDIYKSLSTSTDVNPEHVYPDIASVKMVCYVSMMEYVFAHVYPHQNWHTS